MVSLAQQFEKIALDVSHQASSVNCSSDDYIGGLRYIIETLNNDITAAAESQ